MHREFEDGFAIAKMRAPRESHDKPLLVLRRIKSIRTRFIHLKTPGDA
jgi:hypothetical protein